MRRSTTSGASRATPTRPCRRCSTSSSRRSTTSSQGTVGYFCYALPLARRHGARHLPRRADVGRCRRSLAKASRASPAIACEYATARSNGERRIEPGDIFAPVYGGIGGDGVAEAIDAEGQVQSQNLARRNGPRPDHPRRRRSTSSSSRTREFCTSCHQVAVYPGIKLEVVWEQYRASPACKKGISCQDCHMGRVPGVPQRLRMWPRRRRSTTRRSTTTASSRTTSSTARTTRSPIPASSRST